MALRRSGKGKTIVATISAILCVILLLLVGVVAVDVIAYRQNVRIIESKEYIGSELAPVMEDGVYTFYTDRDFKILHLTDVHIGAGAFSIGKDRKAFDAVETLVKRVKPDLVVVTGDIAYPVPFQSGTLDNRREAELFVSLMDTLGVYYSVTFGNHDTEAYSLYTRDDIYNVYRSSKYCLIDRAEGVDDINYAINVKNSQGIITQTLYMLDTHSYVEGFLDEYDGLHQNQIDWYKAEVNRMNNLNKAVDENAPAVKSLAFFHIPLREYETAWNEYRANGYQNTEGVIFYYGKAKETDEKVCCSVPEDNFFETALELGSTQGMFCGHDHTNFWSIEYKGIRLSYGMSIDHLAYFGIENEHEQRGGTIITVSTSGEMSIEQSRLR
ncbi:MAG: metallophosphoesterase [Clostridia bacterium]|nr:metallophosphoesterase [Clostridia bacterium]